MTAADPFETERQARELPAARAGTVQVHLSGDGPCTKVASLLESAFANKDLLRTLRIAGIEVTKDRPTRSGWQMTLRITEAARPVTP
jgi:hypothetical protein